MKNILLAIAMTLATAGHANAQTGVRAVQFNGTGCISSSTISPGFSQTPTTEVSHWYGFQTIGPGVIQTLYQSNTTVPVGVGNGPQTVQELWVENFVGDPNISNGSHLFYRTTDGTAPGPNQQYSQWASNETLPYSGWHHIYGLSDTSQEYTTGNYLVALFLDTALLTPNPYYTHGNMTNKTLFSTPFTVTTYNNRFIVGCHEDPASGAAMSYYNGDLAEFYADVLGMTYSPGLFNFVQTKPVTGLWGPQDLGDYCRNPRPTDPEPMICLRGGARDIVKNLLPNPTVNWFVNPGGTAPQTAMDDPFIAIQ